VHCQLKKDKESILYSGPFSSTYVTVHTRPGLRSINTAMKRKDPMAVALGSRGGKATAKKMTAEERKEKMRRAAQARWAKAKQKKKE